jgi:hypothetical protein
MIEMVERVAKGIHQTDGMPMKIAVVYARAAIAAMREPTKAMLDAVDHHCDSGGENYPERVKAEDALVVWHQMIDEALNDGA